MAKSQTKILHCIASLHTGGTERMLLKTLPHLKEFSHTICCFSQNGEIGEKLQELGFIVEYIPLSRSLLFLLDISAIRKFRKLLLQYQPELIVTYLPLADIFVRIWARIFGFRNIFCSLRSTLRDKRYILLILLEVITSPLVSRYIAVSKAVKQRFVSFGIRSEKITVIPNGIPEEDRQRTFSKEERKKIKQNLGIPEQEILIGVLGNLRKERGHKYVIRAFADVFKRIQLPVTLVLIGEGPERASLQALTEKLGIASHVRFLGFREDVRELLATFTMAISSSLYEGMSNALLEYMAAGLPIVAVDTPENRELLGDHVSGVLVKSRSVPAISQAIMDILSQKTYAHQLGEAAQCALKKFSLDNTLDQLKKMYRYGGG